MSENISEYVREAKKGNQHAFSKLFELTNQSAYYTALKITKKQQDAEDIVQDAYIKAFTSLESLTNEDKFESWFNCIVANKCRDLLKKKKPELFSKFETDDSDIAFEDTLENKDMSLLPESVTENEALRKLIMDCIEKLPDEQRVCVVMFYYDELSVKEIAQALRIPEGTVKSRLSKARKTLKKDFENIEERDQIKLHSIPYIPLLHWAFQDSSQSVRASKAILHRIFKNTLKVLSKSGNLAAGTGILTSSAIVKIISVVIAVGVAATAATFGIKTFVDNKHDDNKVSETIQAAVPATEKTEIIERYYSESPLAVYSNDKKFIYYISDDGIIQKSSNKKTKIVINRVPENLVYTDSLMYIDDGVLYSYVDGKEEKLQNADGDRIYQYNDNLFSISSDKKTAYRIDKDKEKSENLNIKGNNFRFIDGYIYYYDSDDNLCRLSVNSRKKEVVISHDYTKGFRSSYCIQNGVIYFSGFDSDSNGTIYTSSLASNQVSEIKLDEDGIRDFTVIDNDIYYSTYKGKFCHKTLNGGSELIADKSCYNICNADGYTLWADMDTSEVSILKSGSDDMQKTELPNTIIDFEILENVAYYSTNEGHNTTALGIGE